MPDEPSSTANVEAEPAPENTEVAEQSIQPATTPLAELLRKAAKESGHDIGLQEQPTAVSDETEPEPTEEAEPAETPAEGAEAPQPTAEQETEPPKGLSISEQVAWYKDKGEKPPWYLERISEQSATLAKRTERLERAERERDEARAMAAKASGPQPTPEQPFADVWDRNELSRHEDTFEKLLEFVTKNPDGVENAIVGKDEHGNDIIRSFDRDQIADLRYKADRALRKDIPARRTLLDQRDMWANARKKADAEAFERYPEFKDEESPMTQEAMTLLKQNPNLEYVLGPEVLTWIGRALKGKALEGKNGANGSDATKQIVRSAHTKIAPTPTRTRSMPERKGADMASAKKQLEERGDADAAEALVSSILFKNRGTARKVEPVA